jgi:hypothetical protein
MVVLVVVVVQETLSSNPPLPVDVLAYSEAPHLPVRRPI